MNINIKEFNNMLKENSELSINQKIENVTKFINSNYGKLTNSDCIELLNNILNLKILVREYIDINSKYYKDTKIIKDTNLKKLIESYIYLNGLEQAKELGIDEDNYEDNDEKISIDLSSSKYNSVKIYMDSLKYPVLTREEEQELAIKMKNGDMKARNRLIECNLKLVISIALKIVKRRGELIPFMDMVEEGNAGLIYAIDKYDVSRGTKISTYATSWIVNKITYAIDEQSKVISNPIHFNDTYKKYIHLNILLNNILGREATKYEIAKLLDISPDVIDELETLKGSFVSINSPIGDNDDTELFEIIPDESLEPVYKEYDDQYLKEELSRILSSLTDRERDILYGVFVENRTLDYLGNKYNLTRERIRQISNSLVKKLSQRKDIKRLKLYITEKDDSCIDQVLENKKDFSIRDFKKKNKGIKKPNIVTITSLYEKMKIACRDLQNGKYTYDDLAIDTVKTKKKTID